MGRTHIPMQNLNEQQFYQAANFNVNMTVHTVHVHLLNFCHDCIYFVYSKYLHAWVTGQSG